LTRTTSKHISAGGTSTGTLGANFVIFKVAIRTRGFTLSFQKEFVVVAFGTSVETKRALLAHVGSLTLEAGCAGFDVPIRAFIDTSGVFQDHHSSVTLDTLFGSTGKAVLERARQTLPGFIFEVVSVPAGGNTLVFLPESLLITLEADIHIRGRTDQAVRVSTGYASSVDRDSS